MTSALARIPRIFYASTTNEAPRNAYERLLSWLGHEIAFVEQARFLTRAAVVDFSDLEDVFTFVSRKLENDRDAILELYRGWGQWCEHWKGERLSMRLPREQFEDGMRMLYLVYRDKLQALGRL